MKTENSFSFLHKICENLDKYKSKNAFYINDTFFTYSDFAASVSKIRKGIEFTKKDKSNYIGIMQSTEIETYASVIAVLLSGHGFVVLNPKTPIERNLSIVEQSQLSILLTTSEVEFETTAQIINTKSLPNTEFYLNTSNVSIYQPAYLLFTSGSTGIPKGVPISMANLISFFDSFFSFGYELSEKDNFLQMFDLTFDVSVATTLLPLIVGGCNYAVSFDDVKYLSVYKLLENHEITFATLVPSILSYLKPYFNEIQIDSLKYCILTAEASFQAILEQWQECVPNAKLVNLYGPTEATIWCFEYLWEKEKSAKSAYNGLISIGKPMKNMEAIIINEKGEQVKEGEKGELCISGSHLTENYLNNPEKNKQAFFYDKINGIEKRFYKTGDISFIDISGDYMYCGRLDNQIQIEGFRVELNEIEHYTREYTKLNNIAVLAHENKIGNLELYLFLESSQVDEADLKAYLQSKLPRYMIPKNFLNIPKFPLTASDKIDRIKLREMLK